MTTDTAAAPVSDADKAAAAAVPGQIVAAWANQDADAFAGVFVEDGTMILPGLYRKGRADIRSHMAGAFEGPYRGTRVTGTPIDVRFLSADAAVLVTKGGVLAPGEEEVSAERAIRATWVVVRDNGTWKLASYQNSPA